MNYATNVLLAELNNFRRAADLPDFADWRKARHMPMLEAFRAAAALERIDSVSLADLDLVSSAAELEAEEAAQAQEEMEMEIEGLLIEEELAQRDAAANEKLAKAIENEIPLDLAPVKQPAYKVLARLSPPKSEVAKPVGFVHDFLTANPALSRKEAVAALVAAGVNYSTARTQYQRWFSNRK